MHIDILLPAAGSGRRMGGAGNKLLMPLGGETVFFYTLKHLSTLGACGRLIVLAKAAEMDLLKKEAASFSWGSLDLVWLVGGEERADSVRNGLEYLLQHKGAPLVMTHDAARPFLTRPLVQHLVDALEDADVAVPAIEAAETTRRLLGTGKTKVVERKGLYLTQTPQAFWATSIQKVFFSGLAATHQYTDEVSYFEAADMKVCLVPGDPRNIKLTRPSDMGIAESFLPTFNGTEI